jgi:hypothetical protein
MHKALPTLGAYVNNMSKTPQIKYVDPASIEKEGFIFPEHYLSSSDREKAMAYRKQYRSWRTKGGHGSAGEFSNVVELTPGKNKPPQLPMRPMALASEESPKDLAKALNNPECPIKSKRKFDEFWELSDIIDSLGSPQSKSPEGKCSKLNFDDAKLSVVHSFDSDEFLNSFMNSMTA